MNRIRFIASLFLASIFMLSCSEPTMEEDAKQAAYLTKQSMEYSINKDLNAAESNYKEVQEIMDKYRYTDKFQQFHDLYNLYLEEYIESAE